jgi:hypothetical protein
MEEPKEEQSQPFIIDQLKEYAETHIKLAKYRAIEGGTSIAASLIADLIVAFCMLLAFVFASITLAYYLSDLFHSFWEGFGCVGLIYLLIAIIAKVYKKHLERPIINGIITKIFK